MADDQTLDNLADEYRGNLEEKIEAKSERRIRRNIGRISGRLNKQYNQAIEERADLQTALDRIPMNEQRVRRALRKYIKDAMDVHRLHGKLKALEELNGEDLIELEHTRKIEDFVNGHILDGVDIPEGMTGRMTDMTREILGRRFDDNLKRSERRIERNTNRLESGSTKVRHVMGVASGEAVNQFINNLEETPLASQFTNDAKEKEKALEEKQPEPPTSSAPPENIEEIPEAELPEEKEKPDPIEARKKEDAAYNAVWVELLNRATVIDANGNKQISIAGLIKALVEMLAEAGKPESDQDALRTALEHRLPEGDANGYLKHEDIPEAATTIYSALDNQGAIDPAKHGTAENVHTGFDLTLGIETRREKTPEIRHLEERLEREQNKLISERELEQALRDQAQEALALPENQRTAEQNINITNWRDAQENVGETENRIADIRAELEQARRAAITTAPEEAPESPVVIPENDDVPPEGATPETDDEPETSATPPEEPEEIQSARKELAHAWEKYERLKQEEEQVLEAIGAIQGKPESEITDDDIKEYRALQNRNRDIVHQLDAAMEEASEASQRLEALKEKHGLGETGADGTDGPPQEPADDLMTIAKIAAEQPASQVAYLQREGLVAKLVTNPQEAAQIADLISSFPAQDQIVDVLSTEGVAETLARYGQEEAFTDIYNNLSGANQKRLKDALGVSPEDEGLSWKWALGLTAAGTAAGLLGHRYLTRERRAEQRARKSHKKSLDALARESDELGKEVVEFKKQSKALDDDILEFNEDLEEALDKHEVENPDDLPENKKNEFEKRGKELRERTDKLQKRETDLQNRRNRIHDNRQALQKKGQDIDSTKSTDLDHTRREMTEKSRAWREARRERIDFENKHADDPDFADKRQKLLDKEQKLKDEALDTKRKFSKAKEQELEKKSQELKDKKHARKAGKEGAEATGKKAAGGATISQRVRSRLAGWGLLGKKAQRLEALNRYRADRKSLRAWEGDIKQERADLKNVQEQGLIDDETYKKREAQLIDEQTRLNKQKEKLHKRKTALDEANAKADADGQSKPSGDADGNKPLSADDMVDPAKRRKFLAETGFDKRSAGRARKGFATADEAKKFADALEAEGIKSTTVDMKGSGKLVTIEGADNLQRLDDVVNNRVPPPEISAGDTAKPEGEKLLSVDEIAENEAKLIKDENSLNEKKDAHGKRGKKLYEEEQDFNRRFSEIEKEGNRIKKIEQSFLEDYRDVYDPKNNVYIGDKLTDRQIQTLKKRHSEITALWNKYNKEYGELTAEHQAHRQKVQEFYKRKNNIDLEQQELAQRRKQLENYKASTAGDAAKKSKTPKKGRWARFQGWVAERLPGAGKEAAGEAADKAVKGGLFAGLAAKVKGFKFWKGIRKNRKIGTGIVLGGSLLAWMGLGSDKAEAQEMSSNGNANTASVTVHKSNFLGDNALAKAGRVLGADILEEGYGTIKNTLLGKWSAAKNHTTNVLQIGAAGIVIGKSLQWAARGASLGVTTLGSHVPVVGSGLSKGGALLTTVKSAIASSNVATRIGAFAKPAISLKGGLWGTLAYVGASSALQEAYVGFNPEAEHSEIGKAGLWAGRKLGVDEIGGNVLYAAGNTAHNLAQGRLTDEFSAAEEADIRANYFAARKAALAKANGGGAESASSSSTEKRRQFAEMREEITGNNPAGRNINKPKPGLDAQNPGQGA